MKEIGRGKIRLRCFKCYSSIEAFNCIFLIVCFYFNWPEFPDCELVVSLDMLLSFPAQSSICLDLLN